MASPRAAPTTLASSATACVWITYVATSVRVSAPSALSAAIVGTCPAMNAETDAATPMPPTSRLARPTSPR